MFKESCRKHRRIQSKINNNEGVKKITLNKNKERMPVLSRLPCIKMDLQLMMENSKTIMIPRTKIS